MKYTAEDFKKVNPGGNKRFVLALKPDELAILKKNAKRLGVTATTMIKRCLTDAGMFNVKEEEDDTEPLLRLGG